MAEEFLNQISAKCSVIIGAGQAGLSLAHSLKKGIKPLILKKNYVEFSWKNNDGILYL